MLIKIRRWLGTILAVLMVFAFMPVVPGVVEEASAATETYGIVCSTDGKIYKGTATEQEIHPIGMNWSYSDGQGTLKLNSFSFNTTGDFGLKVPGNTQIELTGDNKLTCLQAQGLIAAGNLTVTGTGSLNVSVLPLYNSNADVKGIACGEDLTIDGTKVTVSFGVNEGHGDSYGISAEKSIKFTGSTVSSENALSDKAKGESIAIIAGEGDIYINGGEVAAVSAGVLNGGYAIGMNAALGNITVDGAIVSAKGAAGAGLDTGGYPAESRGISVDAGTFSSINGADVTATGGMSNGASYGLYADGDITADGSVLKGTGGTCDLAIDQNNSRSATSSGIYNYQHGVLFAKNGAKVTATSGNAIAENSSTVAPAAAKANSWAIRCGYAPDENSGEVRTPVIEGSGTTVTATSGKAVTGGAAENASRCAASSIAYSVYAQDVKLKVNDRAHVKLTAGSAGSSNYACRTCISYGYMGSGPEIGESENETGAIVEAAGGEVYSTTTDTDAVMASFGINGSGLKICDDSTVSSSGDYINNNLTYDNGSPVGISYGIYDRSAPSIVYGGTVIASGKLGAYRFEAAIAPTYMYKKVYVGSEASGENAEVKLDTTKELNDPSYHYVRIVPATKVDLPTVSENLTYNGNAQQAVPVGLLYTLSGDISKTDVGEYLTFARLSDDGDYCWSNGNYALEGFRWSIDPAEPTVSLADKTAEYTGSPIEADAPTVTGVAEGDAPAGYTTTYSYYKDEGCTQPTTSADGAVSSGSAPANIGTYYVKVSISAVGNYSESTSDKAVLRIAEHVLNEQTTTAEVGSLTYNGSPQTPDLTVKYKGMLLVRNENYKVEFTDADGRTITQVTDAGRYYVIITGINEYEGAFNSEFIVNRAANTIDILTTDVTKTGSVSKATVFIRAAKATFGMPKYVSSMPKYVKVHASGKVTIVKNWTGTAKITVGVSGNLNYKAAASKAYVVKVKPGKMVVKKVTNDNDRKIKVFWTKMIGADKYQIRAAYSKNMKKGNKTYTVKGSAASKTTGKLKKGKTYYVQIRAYDSQTKAWGGWSAKKKCKVKK